MPDFFSFHTPPPNSPRLSPSTLHPPSLRETMPCSSFAPALPSLLLPLLFLLFLPHGLIHASLPNCANSSNSASPTLWDFAILVDAGSGGSRCHIYRWPRRHAKGSIPPFTGPQPFRPQGKEGPAVRSTSPGLSSFQDRPEEAVQTILPLIRWAKGQLSEYTEHFGSIPFYLKATAGMRLIRNLPVRDRIMNTIRDTLADPAQSPFKFQRTYARVISGEEEGVYGWLAINYLYRTLLNTPVYDTYGALDLGGASTQITFRPVHDVLEGYFPIRLRQEKLRLYTHSFLHFGHDAIVQRSLATLFVNTHISPVNSKNDKGGSLKETVKDNAAVVNAHSPTDFSRNDSAEEGEALIFHPCLPAGFEHRLFLSTTEIDFMVESLATDEQMSEEDSRKLLGKPLTVRGLSQAQECKDLLVGLLWKHNRCWTNTCSFAGMYQPRLESIQFVAFSGFYKAVVKNLGLPFDVSLSTLGHTAHEVCSLDADALAKRFPNYTMSFKHSAQFCLQSMYIFTLLHQGYNMDLMGTRILFLNKKDGVELEWTLGSVLYEANAFPWVIDHCPNAPSYDSQLDQVEAPPSWQVSLSDVDPAREAGDASQPYSSTSPGHNFTGGSMVSHGLAVLFGVVVALACSFKHASFSPSPLSSFEPCLRPSAEQPAGAGYGSFPSGTDSKRL